MWVRFCGLSLLLGALCLTTGCATLGALGGTYPQDEVDRFHEKVERLHVDLQNTEAGFSRIRARLRDVADGYRGEISQVQKDIRSLRDLIKALQRVPRRANTMRQSAKVMLSNAPRHYVGNRAPHLARKTHLLNQAQDWLDQMPDQSARILADAQGLVRCGRELVKGKAHRARCDLGTVGEPVEPSPVETADTPVPLRGDTRQGGSYTNQYAEPGSSSLMFDLHNLLDAPRGLDQVGLGYRYVASETLQVRLSVGLDNVSSEIGLVAQDDVNTESSDFSVGGALEYVVRRNDNLTLYIGGLTQIGFSGSDDGVVETEGSSFTLAAVTGVDWFVTHRLSLSAEYRFGLFRTELTEEGPFEGETSSALIGTGSAAFMLGFWF